MCGPMGEHWGLKWSSPHTNTKKCVKSVHFGKFSVTWRSPQILKAPLPHGKWSWTCWWRECSHKENPNYPVAPLLLSSNERDKIGKCKKSHLPHPAPFIEVSLIQHMHATKPICFRSWLQADFIYKTRSVIVNFGLEVHSDTEYWDLQFTWVCLVNCGCITNLFHKYSLMVNFGFLHW